MARTGRTYATDRCEVCGQQVTRMGMGRAAHERMHKRERFAAGVAAWQSRHGDLAPGRRVAYKTGGRGATVAVVRKAGLCISLDAGGVLVVYDVNDLRPMEA